MGQQWDSACPSSRDHCGIRPVKSRRKTVSDLLKLKRLKSEVPEVGVGASSPPWGPPLGKGVFPSVGELSNMRSTSSGSGSCPPVTVMP